jgi:tetratricopeptide (TPR) repeat protein
METKNTIEKNTIELIEKLYDENNFEKSIEICQKELSYNNQTNINKTYLFNMLGNNYSNIENVENSDAFAIEYYNKAIEIDPTNLTAFFNLAHLYINLEKYDKAIKYFNKYIELVPNDSETYYYLAIATYKRWVNKELDKIPFSEAQDNKFNLSFEYFNKAIEINPTNSFYYYELALAHEESCDRYYQYNYKFNLEEAIKNIKIAIELAGQLLHIISIKNYIFFRYFCSFL